MAEQIITEEWRPVEGYEDSYQVSSLGRIKSLERLVLSDPKTGRTRLHHGRILKPYPRKTGPRSVYYWVGLNRKQHSVHSLVTRAFHGPPPSPEHEVAHWNRDTSDNSKENLRWVTPKENQEDRKRHGTYWQNPKGKLTPVQVREIRAIPYRHGLFSAMAIRYGITIASVSKVYHGKCWTEEHLRHVENQTVANQVHCVVGLPQSRQHG